MREPVVLYIEDSPFYQEMLRRNISLNNEIHFAANGLDGLIKTLSALPDFIFLDVMLPDTRGPDLIPKIRKYLPKSYIVMVTSDNTVETVSEAKSFGANGYVVKPFSLGQINKQLDRWIGEYGDLDRPLITPEITAELKRLTDEKENVELSLQKSEYVAWMEERLPPTTPYLFIEKTEVSILYKNQPQLCTVLLAFRIHFDGRIYCIGAWNELKGGAAPSPYLIKSMLKDLKSRGAKDIFIIVHDPDLSSIVDLNIEYPLSKVFERLLPFKATSWGQSRAHKELAQKLITIASVMSFDKSIEMLSIIKPTIDKVDINLYPAVSESLLGMKLLFVYPKEIRWIALETRWLQSILIKLQENISLRGTFESIGSMQAFIFSSFGRKDINTIMEASLDSKDLMVTPKEINEALYTFSKTLPERFPKDEIYE